MADVLAAVERESLVRRASEGLAALSFSREDGNRRLEDKEIQSIVHTVENRAYAAASAAATTTTGARERQESIDLYVKMAAGMVLTAAKQGGIAGTQTAREAGQNRTRTDQGSPIRPGVLDLHSDDRYFVDRQRAEELLDRMLREENTFHTVRLSTKGFGEASAVVVAQAFQKHIQTLQRVDISDIISGRHQQEALKVLEIVTMALEGASVKVLNLSDQALGETGIRACATALQNPNIEELYLENIGCSHDACIALRELLAAPEKLKKLQLHNNMTGDEGATELAAIIRRAPNLEHLRITSSRVGEEGGQEIAQALMGSCKLKALDLQDNLLGEATAHLANALLSHPDLEVLNLSYNCMEDEGADALATCLQTGKDRLRELHVAGNDISEDGIRNLAVALGKAPALQMLNFAENALGDSGSLILSSQLFGERCRSLTHLDISSQDPPVTKYGAIAVTRCVASKERFELLEMNGNCIQAEGIELARELLIQSLGNDKCLGSLSENEASDAEEWEDRVVHDISDITDAFLQNFRI
eukprot:CAMPEP_0183826332 /NCGR_PEP_ID=MMETSP0807_2-20130328/1641_1 /TAXON_ID=88271 /ORGANISM="Picocystis salinarum, Strain CCMP1897" /LENGTH=532 /DNA_ID=CAMNT_0026071437 /DNA_START=61 /DNA_END=1659 /DNA_ORIENTATION=-